MSVSYHVIGFKPPDETFEMMRTIYRACDIAGVKIPNEVEEYFDFGEPDDEGVEVEIAHETWATDMREGFQVKLSDIPADVKILRFYASY